MRALATADPGDLRLATRARRGRHRPQKVALKLDTGCGRWRGVCDPAPLMQSNAEDQAHVGRVATVAVQVNQGRPRASAATSGPITDSVD